MDALSFYKQQYGISDKDYDDREQLLIPDIFMLMQEYADHVLGETKPPEYEYYMNRKGVFYFRNGEVKLKQTPDMKDEMQFNFYNAVQSRGYGVKYKFISY